MKTIIYLITFMILITGSLFTWYGCGGGGSTPGGQIDHTTIVSSTTFEGSQMGVPVNGGATAKFSRAMDPNSFTSDTAYIATDGGNNIPCNISWNSDHTEATCTPSQELEICRDYTITFAGGENGVKDANGNYLDANLTIQFSTIYRYGDEFDNAETLTKCWTTLPGSDIYAMIDINTSSEGKLTFRFSNDNHTGFGNVMIYKGVSGNFAVSTYISDSNHVAVGGGSTLFGIVNDINDFNIGFSVWNFPTAHGNNCNTFSYGPINGQYFQKPDDGCNDPSLINSIYWCIVRNGTTITAYRSADAGSWTEIASTELSLSDPLYLFYGGDNTDNTDNFYFKADYLRFNFDDPPACPGF